jgi:hypothetical protein
MKYTDYNFTQEAILYDNVNKYENPAQKHPFYIKALVPFETEVGRTIMINRSNIMNTDLSWLSTSKMVSEITLDLYIPRYVVSDYPNKYIPKGTKFLVTFVGGNINNVQIIGRCH